MRRVLLVVIGVVALLAVTALVVVGLMGTPGPDGPDRVAVRIVDRSGDPVRADVELLPAPGANGRARTVRAAVDGSVRAAVDRPTLARVAADGFLSRVVALDPGRVDDVALTRRTDDGVSLRFGGDVMMGRRYFVADGARQAWLSPQPTAAELARPLEAVAPMLGDADVTVVNLETALVEDPWFVGPRPRWAHPEKELLVTSPLGLAAALEDAGVDVVDLANNHVFDALDRGVATTIDAVEEAGLVHFGAGPTVEAAWKPAYVESHGQRVAFVGCTTVDGAQHRLGYVATADHGGAAACEAGRLTTALRAAKEHADTVVFMVHGGTEYVREQTDDVRRFSRLAVDLGASVVVNGHPHVVGGVTSDRGVPVVESAGNLLFDQDLWETFLSYLPRVEIAGGRVVRTVLDPIMIDGYQPTPVVGRPGAAAARIGSARMDGPLGLAGGGAASVVVGATPEEDALRVEAGHVAGLPDAAWLAPGQRATAGHDLLFGTGGFEAVRPGQGHDAAPLWTLGRFAEVAPEATCGGATGLVLRRSPVSQRDVVAAPAHRQPVEPGQRLTLVADVKQASAGAWLELRWYAGMAGGSMKVSRLAVPRVSPGRSCTQVRFDVVVPDHAMAVQPWLRLEPPHDVHLAAHLALDDVRLVAWSETPGRRDDIIDPRDDGEVRLVRDPVHR